VNFFEIRRGPTGDEQVTIKESTGQAVFVSDADCTDCGCGLTTIAPPLQVTQRPVKRIVSRRAAFGVTMKASALSLLAACSPAASPTAVQPAASPAAQATAAPASQPAATTVPVAQPTAAPVAQPTAAAVAQPTAAPAAGPLEKVELAFCSQVLCILPYEVARQRGFFAAEGLDVELVYMRGGAQAMSALLAQSIDWVGTPMDLVVQAAAKGQKAIQLVSTARLPFFALVTSPKAQDVGGVKDLAGKKIGVGNLGTTDHLMAQFLLKNANVDPNSVEFVALGPNLYDILVQGQVDAGMVQEPSLTLLERAGGKSLVNFMSLKDAQTHLGGPYQFMGLNTRPEVLERKTETARKLVNALVKANKWMLDSPGARVVEAAPSELVAGGNVELFANVLDRHKADLYPADGKLDGASIQRVIDIQRSSGALGTNAEFKAEDLFTNKLLPSGG
jgi:NitT/TauT family transport system substrate-binding protein